MELQFFLYRLYLMDTYNKLMLPGEGRSFKIQFKAIRSQRTGIHVRMLSHMVGSGNSVITATLGLDVTLKPSP